MKKFLMFVTILFAVMIFASCGSNENDSQTVEPVFVPQESVEPTEPPHIHSWTEATCHEPQICTDCDETQGDPLPHEWRVANFQEPQTCTACEETEGDPLIPSFEQHGLEVNMELGTAHEYILPTWQNPSVNTVGTLTITDYQIVESDDRHEYREGYEWRIIHWKSEHGDRNAQNLGLGHAWTWLGYYEPWEHTGMAEFDEERDAYVYSITRNFWGVDYDILIMERFIQNEWVNNRVYTLSVITSFQVPVGYDGMMLIHYSSANAPFISFADYTPPEDADFSHLTLMDIVDEDTLFFRLD
jgi:hypothetical protein